MREIKFRGKSKDGHWVYGFVFKDEDGCFIKVPYRAHRYGSGIEVDEKTVGIFTGLRDFNGEEVYQGDILYDDRWGYGVVCNSIYELNDLGQGYPVWSIRLLSYQTIALVCNKDGKIEETLEGNKFDNPELIQANG